MPNGYHRWWPDNQKKSFPPERMTKAVFRGTAGNRPVCVGDDQFPHHREKPA
jgi:hypothetical protein